MKNTLSEKTIKQQQKVNTFLAEVLKKYGIEKCYITSLGNSLATGYSICHTCKPLLFRNESLKAIFENSGIEAVLHHFTREENNNDEHIHEWYHTNRKEEDFFKFNRLDAIIRKFKGLTNEDIETYYPEKPKRNDGLKDVIMTDGDNLANIVIYSGSTGSFLDNATRGGIPKKLIGGFKRDYVSLEATLKDIENNNRNYKTNTQVYLYGVPNYMGLGLTDKIINKNLKAIAARYSNVKYVEPVKAKFIYKNGVDVHLSEEEYADYLNNVMEDIANNYPSVKAKIEIDRDLLSITDIIKNKNEDEVNDAILKYLEKYLPSTEGIDIDLTDYVNNIKNSLINAIPQEEKDFPNGTRHYKLLEEENKEYEIDNIIVCNCETGEIYANVDNIQTRIYGINEKNFIELENLLMNTQADNRRNGMNIKVYLYGNPDGASSDIINIIKKYAHADFIKGYYQAGIGNDDVEDEMYIISIIDHIIDTKEELEAIINIDRDLYLLNEQVELLGLTKGFTKKAEEPTGEIIEKYSKEIAPENKVEFFKRLKSYLLERAPYDFFFVGQKNIKKKIKCQKKYSYSNM